MPGFPIRKSWDHSLVDSSPRPIAASHVLHRLLVPRHPPFALDNLTTENKMLASTVQFSTNDQPTTPQPTPNPDRPPEGRPSSGMQTRPCLAPKQQPPRGHPPHSGPNPPPHPGGRTSGCSFRTQQGAPRPAPPHRPPVPAVTAPPPQGNRLRPNQVHRPPPIR